MPPFVFVRLGAMAEREDIRARARERVADATAAASGRVADAKATASERVADARTAASERVADAKAAAEQFIARQKPRLRGVSHEWAFFVSLGAVGALVVAGPTPAARLAAATYPPPPSRLPGASLPFHRVPGRRAEFRRGMRGLAHSMLF